MNNHENNVQQDVELELEVEQPVVELEQWIEPLYIELYDFSRPVDPLFYIHNFLEDELIYAGESTIPSTSNNSLTSLNYENDLNSNSERQRHQCHHKCTYQNKQFYEMKRHWKKKHKDIAETTTSDKFRLRKFIET
ncbi:35274_t:CDS:2 [Gigaspora margarita]|uniref:35274_t:CDS:1 n=1 Tax=Gigaspora margarita TaxID=4874 RepID=A0ABN7UFE0_GIGMA|nr:35274_t:CDS:2 [Gigaspora margarita]